MVGQIAGIFDPTEVAVAVTVDGATADTDWGTSLPPLAGYTTTSSSAQQLRAGGRVTFITLAADSSQAPADGSAAKVQPLQQRASSDSNLSEASSEAPFPPVPSPLESMPSAYSSDSEDTLAACSLDDDFPSPQKLPPCVPLSGDAAGDGPAVPNPAVAAALAARRAVPLPAVENGALDAHIAALIKQRGLDDTFYMLDLGVVAALHAAWERMMPRVRPFYAVKCDSHPQHNLLSCFLFTETFLFAPCSIAAIFLECWGYSQTDS